MAMSNDELRREVEQNKALYERVDVLLKAPNTFVTVDSGLSELVSKVMMNMVSGRFSVEQKRQLITDDIRRFCNSRMHDQLAIWLNEDIPTKS